MRSKSLTIILLGLALCCFLQGAIAQEQPPTSGQFDDAVYQEMNEGDGSTLPYELVELRHKAVVKAIEKLVSNNTLPQSQYTTERIFATEVATNYERLHRFNVQIRAQSGVESRIWFTTLTSAYNQSLFYLVDAGLKENRIGEFPHTEFKVLPPVEESQQPYPQEVEDLRTRSVNQALGRLIAKNILPQGSYSFFNTYGIEYSSIINMTEYPDHDDMLYRFDVRVENQLGAIFRLKVVIATNYETPEYYELIDYVYKQSRLVEFTTTDWREMNEDEDLPFPPEIIQMRNRSVAQAIPRLQAEGILPEGQYTIAKTYVTEFSGYFENSDWPYLRYTPEDTLYRFNVQLSNTAGEKFRVAVVVASTWNIQPKYELLDYFYVENRLGEFANTNFRSLNVGDIQTESINEAVDRLITKDTLPQGTYTISKTLPTEFSANFEHPDYSTDSYVLYKFTAQVKNAANAEYKVYAIVITAYDTPENFELIDYGEVNA